MLKPAQSNEYSHLKPPSILQQDFALPLASSAEKELSGLRVDSGTGPDDISARVLRFCARQLAKPVTYLILRILQMTLWPDGWREHWVAPMFNKGAVFDAANYRGIHLTAQLSKVAERMLKLLLEPFMEGRETGGTCAPSPKGMEAFGHNQFAYRAG